MQPSLVVKLSDFIICIPNKRTIDSNSRPPSAGKHSAEPYPSLPKRRIFAAILVSYDVRVFITSSLTRNFITCAKSSCARYSREVMASPVVLATFVVQVKGVKFYDYRNSRVNRGEHVIVLRRSDNPFDANCPPKSFYHVIAYAQLHHVR